MSSSIRLCLFDLDGTLIDSERGILGSIRHAFGKVDAEVPPDEVLRTWIGPPFHQSFPTVLGDDLLRTESAIESYREHYLAQGWSQHTIYPGIAELIEALAATGCALGVVTTKPLPQARQVMDALPFGSQFMHVYGPEPHVTHSNKAQMVARALDDFGVPAASAAMIGDRHFDIAGALANHVAGMGVLWGFGTREELEQAGAHAIAATPDELGRLLLA